MSILRSALVVVTGLFLLACNFEGWDRDPDRCKGAGPRVYCDGNAIVSGSLVCVGDDHLESGDRHRSECPVGLTCSYDKGYAACTDPNAIADGGTKVDADAAADVSDAGSDDAASDPDAPSIDIRH